MVNIRKGVYSEFRSRLFTGEGLRGGGGVEPTLADVLDAPFPDLTAMGEGLTESVVAFEETAIGKEFMATYFDGVSALCTEAEVCTL
jgi:hypothetical protein